MTNLVISTSANAKTVVINHGIAGATGTIDPAANINFTATNVQRNGVEIATVDDISPFDLAADYDTTGEWSYSINGKVQQLMTDDPTLAAATYAFLASDGGLDPDGDCEYANVKPTGTSPLLSTVKV